MLLLVLLICLCAASGAQAQLVISEALSAPASDWNGDGTIDSRDDEWIEVRNDGSLSESLDGVFYRDGTGANYHFAFSGTLAAGESLLVFGSDAVAWQESVGESTTGLSLNNSGDRLELWRDTTLLFGIDVPAHAAAADRSFALATDGATWLLYDGLSPYAGSALPSGSNCVPTPGAANNCSAGVPVDASSFSRLKSLYGD